MLLKETNKCLQPNPVLSFDEACLDLVNTFNDTAVSIWGQYSECHKCDYEKEATLEATKNTSVLISTRFPLELFYKVNGSSNATCRFTKLFAEHYRYQWNISAACSQTTIKVPADSAYLPILTAFIVLFCFGTCWYMVKCIYKNSAMLRRLVIRNRELEEDLGQASTSSLVGQDRPQSQRKHPNRIKSIDVFRGFCIVVMIFVNYGGGRYWFFAHSAWNGLTIADLVFPWFLFLMGVSLTVSLHAKLFGNAPVSRARLAKNVLRRSLILILLGVVINSNQNLQTIGSLRFPGVLQRFGLTYLVVGLLEVCFVKRLDNGDQSWLQNVLFSWRQDCIVTALVIIHTCPTFFLDVPGCGRGYLGPGGRDSGGKFFNCTGGAAGYIDRSIFGEHMYKTPRCRILYETTMYYDPEGLLGTLTSILTVHLGVKTGRILINNVSLKTKVIQWTIYGVGWGLVGGYLCNFRKDDGFIPINKQLWSLSFVLVLCGSGSLIFAVLYVLIDVTRKWGGRPFFYPGMNAIVLYVGHELFRNTFPFAWTPTQETHGAYLFMNLWGTAVWVAISIFLYKRNIFLAL